MSFSYQLDRETRRMITQVQGQVEYPDIEAHMNSEIREGVHPYGERIHAEGATASLSPAEVRQCVRLLEKLATQSTLGPTAVIVSDDLSYGMLRMLGILLEETCAIRPFRTVEEARVWLGWSQ